MSSLGMHGACSLSMTRAWTWKDENLAEQRPGFFLGGSVTVVAGRICESTTTNRVVRVYAVVAAC